MTLHLKFDQNDHVYTIDLLKLLEKLNIKEDQVMSAVQDMLSKS